MSERSLIKAVDAGADRRPNDDTASLLAARKNRLAAGAA
jgi:hypothetical protein